MKSRIFFFTLFLASLFVGGCDKPSYDTIKKLFYESTSIENCPYYYSRIGSALNSCVYLCFGYKEDAGKPTEYIMELKKIEIESYKISNKLDDGQYKVKLKLKANCEMYNAEPGSLKPSSLFKSYTTENERELLLGKDDYGEWKMLR